MTGLSARAARLALVAAGITLLSLASLHLLSPEFDPSLRAVSEYANGRHGWMLTLMFASWALSSWALVPTLRPFVKPAPARIGLGFLVAAGAGEAMACLFDINHPLHGLAGLIGVLSLPVAAMLITVCFSRSPEWSGARHALLWTANATWASLTLLILVLAVDLWRAGGRVTRDSFVFVGWADRLMIVAYCAWQAVIAAEALHRIPNASP